MARLKVEEISKANPAENSALIKERVLTARAIQKKRFGRSTFLNCQMRGREIRNFVELDDVSQKILEQVMRKFLLSYRAVEKILKVSRTIADLDGSARVSKAHLMEALNYRMFKNYF